METEKLIAYFIQHLWFFRRMCPVCLIGSGLLLADGLLSPQGVDSARFVDGCL
jgi:hypothetical protein